MPYTITTGKRFYYPDSGVGGVQIESRFAVATLEEARDKVYELVENMVDYPAHEATSIGEAGGTIDLPDGTVIEVRKSAN
jgi:hypothetical protein